MATREQRARGLNATALCRVAATNAQPRKERALQTARADYTQGSFGHRDWPRAMAIQPQTR
jgi:hypothetical protein